jgi:hypothetical protein
MSPAKPTPSQIRDRRAKKAAIVLGVLFVAALAIQGPKLLKAAHKSSSPIDTTSVNASQVAGASSTATSPTAVAVGALAVQTTPSQLRSFSRFAVKDPFHAQNVTATTASGTGAAAPSTAPPTSTQAATTTTTAAKPPAPSTDTTVAQTTTTATAPTQFTVTTPSAPPNAAILMANGKREIVPVGAEFPTEDPLFKLNALREKEPAIRISVVGGSFTNGVKTIPLLHGKTLTFANESDGSRYVIKLVRLTNIALAGISGAPAAGTAGSGAAAATGTTPAGA